MKKVVVSILLGLMLVTSTLVGFAYATPLQPTQNVGGSSCSQLQRNSPGYIAAGCGSGHDGSGGTGDPHSGCPVGQKSPDGCRACPDGITPNDLATSDINVDGC